MAKDDDFFTPDELAHRWKLKNARVVYRMVSLGLLVSTRVTRRILVSRDEVLRFEASRQVCGKVKGR